jgi:sulfur carrier protein
MRSLGYDPLTGSNGVKITVNGDAEMIAEGAAVSDLLAKFELAPQRVAVEVNEALVPRANYPEVRLEDGDRVEIVTFVGGG